MKVALINPRTDGTRVNSKLKKIATIFRVTLPVLAAYTPKDIDLRVYEESVEDIDFNEEFDLVGISVLTSSFQRAREISEEYSDNGTKVVWGGIHPTIMPEESKKYADSIIKYNGELAWRNVLSDFKNGRLKEEYIGQMPIERILPERNILSGKSFFSFATVETSRGCPYSCDYCSTPLLNGGKFQKFSIDSVIHDIQSIDSNFIFFVDDNLLGNKKHAKELFERMKGLGKSWLSQASIHIAEDDELLKAAVEAGCKGLYIGFESVYQGSLDESRKNNNVSKYSDLIKKIHDYGIAIEGGFIFGFDSDDKSVFEKTIDFVDKTKIDSPNYHVLTPYPGTPLFERLKLEGRIITQDWSKYNTGNVVFRPKQMTSGELLEGYNWIHDETYGLSNIFRRVISSKRPLYTLVANLPIKKKN